MRKYSTEYYSVEVRGLMPGFHRELTFRWTGNRPPDNGVERDVLIGVYRRHPGLQMVQWNDWGIWLSDPNRMGILSFDWQGPPDPDWGAITSIYQVAAAQKGSSVTWEGRASGAPPSTLPSVPGPAGSAPVPAPTGRPSPMVFQTVPSSGAGPALGRSPLSALAAALGARGSDTSGGSGGAGKAFNPWLLAALVLLGIGVVAAATKK